MTPCLISRSVVAEGPGRVTSVGYSRMTVHSRTDPCGRCPDDAVPTFAEWVEDWLDGYVATVRPCRFCGGSL